MATAVLFVGLTGSGKTTVSLALARHGYIRLSVDEEVHRLHGRYGVDYPEDSYFEREAPVVEAIWKKYVALLEEGDNVVLDYGLWRRYERESWRRAADEAGAKSVVVYIPVSRDELLRRLEERNQREDANALTAPRRL